MSCVDRTIYTADGLSYDLPSAYVEEFGVDVVARLALVQARPLMAKHPEAPVLVTIFVKAGDGSYVPQVAAVWKAQA